MTATAPPPAVSVLIPAYQAEATLERAVLSALQQTVADVEVLVLDDGSTDRTRQVAERLAAQDARVRVLPSSANVGVAATRNRGLDAAQGTWVALLDADDAWLPGRLERLLAASGDVDVVCDDVLLLRGDDLARGEVVGVRVLPWLGLRLRQPRLLRLDEFVEHDLGYLKPMFRRRALDTRCLRYWPNLRVAEDFAFAVVALASGLSWRQVPEAHYCYVRRGGSLSAGLTAVAEQHVAMLQSLCDVPQVAALPGAVPLLERHARRAQAALVHHDLRALVRARSVPQLLVALARRPDAVRLMLAKTARRARLVVLRRLLHADRLPEASQRAVRALWGLPPAPGSAPGRVTR